MPAAPALLLTGLPLLHRPNFPAPGYWIWCGNVQLHLIQQAYAAEESAHSSLAKTGDVNHYAFEVLYNWSKALSDRAALRRGGAGPWSPAALRVWPCERASLVPASRRVCFYPPSPPTLRSRTTSRRSKSA